MLVQEHTCRGGDKILSLEFTQQYFVTGSLLSRRWKVKHQRVLQLTLLPSALLTDNLIFKLIVLFTI